MRSSIKRFIAGASLAGAIGIGGAAVASAQSSAAPKTPTPAAADPTDPSGSTQTPPSTRDGLAPAGGRHARGGGDSSNCPNMGGDTQTPSTTPSPAPASAQNAET